MVQQVLDIPELKIAKPSDTHWLAHEKCVKAVKVNHAAIVTALMIFMKYLGLTKLSPMVTK